MMPIGKTDDGKSYFTDYNGSVFYTLPESEEPSPEYHPVNGNPVPKEIWKKLSSIKRETIEEYFWMN